MIVLSGALVLVALVLLVVGALGRDLPYVYGSIGVSVAALLLLFVSILQRRGQAVDGEQATDVSVTSGGEAERAPALVGAEQSAAGEPEARRTGPDERGAPVLRRVRRPDLPAQAHAQEASSGPDVRGDDSHAEDEAHDGHLTGEHEAPEDEQVPSAVEAYDDEDHDDADHDDADHDDADHDDADHDDDDHDDEEDEAEAVVDEAAEDEAAEDEAVEEGVDEAGAPDVQEGARLVPAPQAQDEDRSSGPAVLVVAGRPRYHRSSCRYLIGKAPESVALEDARAQGFSPCGVCKPDAAALDEPQGDRPQDEQPQDEQPHDEQPHDEQPQGDRAQGDRAQDGSVQDELAADDGAQDDLARDEQDEPAHDSPAHDSPAHDEQAHDEQAPGEQAPGEQLAPSPRSAAGHAPPQASVAADEQVSLEEELFGGQVFSGPHSAPDHVVAAGDDSTPQPEPSGRGRRRAGALTARRSRGRASVEVSADLPAEVTPEPAAEEGPGSATPPQDESSVASEVTPTPGRARRAGAASDEPDTTDLAGPSAPQGGPVAAAPEPTSTDEPVQTTTEQPDAVDQAWGGRRAAKAPATAAGKEAPTPRTRAKRASTGAAAQDAPTDGSPVPEAAAGAGRPSRGRKAPAKSSPPAASAAPKGARARKAPDQPPAPPVRTAAVRAVRADALRLAAPTGATTTRKVAVRQASPVVRPATPAVTPAGKGGAAATSPAPRAGQVVVIPDRGRFHRADCRYVRGVAGATALSKAAAAQQGYVACGVCQP